jgi:guanosine-3',5'-bis(diphosphate) 3'-pyrophosphohydrolase
MASRNRIEVAGEDTALIRGALAVARCAHAGQVRETGNGEIPFIDHPLAVAQRLTVDNYPSQVLAAGLLHDTVEQAGLAPDELRERFGEEIASIVVTLTEDPTIEDYEERKQELRERVATAGPDARAVFAADKAANVAVLRKAYEILAEDVAADLPVPLDAKILVWEYDLEMLFERSPGVLLADRLADELLGLWGQRIEDGRATLC